VLKSLLVKERRKKYSPGGSLPETCGDYRGADSLRKVKNHDFFNNLNKIN